MEHVLAATTDGRITQELKRIPDEVLALFDASVILVEALIGLCGAGRGRDSIPPSYAGRLEQLERAAKSAIPLSHRRMRGWGDILKAIDTAEATIKGYFDSDRKRGYFSGRDVRLTSNRKTALKIRLGSIPAIAERIGAMRAAAGAMREAERECERLQDTWEGRLDKTLRPGLSLLRDKNVISEREYSEIQASWANEGADAWNIAAACLAGVGACLLRDVEACAGRFAERGLMRACMELAGISNAEGVGRDLTKEARNIAERTRHHASSRLGTLRFDGREFALAYSEPEQRMLGMRHGLATLALGLARAHAALLGGPSTGEGDIERGNGAGDAMEATGGEDERSYDGPGNEEQGGGEAGNEEQGGGEAGYEERGGGEAGYEERGEDGPDVEQGGGEASYEGRGGGGEATEGEGERDDGSRWDHVDAIGEKIRRGMARLPLDSNLLVSKDDAVKAEVFLRALLGTFFWRQIPALDMWNLKGLHTLTRYLENYQDREWGIRAMALIGVIRRYLDPPKFKQDAGIRAPGVVFIE